MVIQIHFSLHGWLPRILTAGPHIASVLLHPSGHWLTIDRITLPIILLATSPIPMGLTPGCLSMAMSLHDVITFRPTGSTKMVQKRRPTAATALRRSRDASWKEEHICLQSAASNPEGSAAPSICIAVVRMSWPVILSNRMGCVGEGASSTGRIAEG